MNVRRFFGLVGAATLLASCAVTPKTFYDNPGKQDVTSLCRALFETTDAQFQSDVAAELTKRKMTIESCQAKIDQQNTAIAAVALVGTVAAVGVIAANGGGGNYGSAYVADEDCRGGSGDGPYYVTGPVWVGSHDPHNLDADNDGWGCELSDIGFGA